jgi:hypothetical protein
MMALAAPLLLDRARAAYDGELMLMKGPEVAVRYRYPTDRAFRDLDLLVDDPPAAQRALVAAGFVEGGNPENYDDAQHLRPLAWPGLPLVIELHRWPSCPPWLTPPSIRAILRCAAPSAAGGDGVLAPTPAAHALLLAAHGWTHGPLSRLGDLADVAAVLGPGDRRRADDLAREWGWEGMWRTTIGVADAMLAAEGAPHVGLRWARHLETVRERTVLEGHVAQVAAPACTVPLRQAPGAVTAAVTRTASRRPGEPWADKLRRSFLAVAHAFMDQSDHVQTLHIRSKEKE